VVLEDRYYKSLAGLEAGFGKSAPSLRLEEVREVDKNIYSAPLSIKELHEFLMVEGLESVSEPLEMRALYA